MYHKADLVFKNPEDYKICYSCNSLNLVDNNYCWFCGSNDFDYDLDHILEWIDKYYKEYFEEGLTEQEIDNTEIQVS